MRPILLVLTLLALCGGCGKRQIRPATYSAPPGFLIEPAAPAAQLGPLATFTFDSLGRPVVAKARRFATLMLDRNRDGVYETEKILTTRVSIVRGIWFDGRTMYLIGTGEDGQFGLYRLEDKNGDDEMDSFEQLSQFPTMAGDTAPHDIRRGPDGRPTLALGAALSRWNEESRDLTAIATGMGNPQAHAYSPDGEALVSDRGNEGDAGLPSHGGSRLLHVIPGGDYSHPPHRLDSLPPMLSPPASPLEFYRHHVYPPNYRGALFEVRMPGWRIGAARLRPLGATFDAVPLAGEFVLADATEITAMEVGPDGFLYFSCGGAGSRGGLFRIRYTLDWRERWRQLSAGPRTPENALALARQPQPLSSWGHAALQKQKDLLGANWGEYLETLAGDAKSAAEDRVQAIQLLGRFGPRSKPELVERWLKDGDARVRAAAIGAGGQRKETAVAAGLDDPDPRVRRKAAESLEAEGGGASIDAVFKLLSEPDRFVRSSARQALERLPRELWQPRVMAVHDPRAALEAMFALLRAPGATPDDRDAILERLAEGLSDTRREMDLRLDTLRLFSVAAAAPGGTPDKLLLRRVAALLVPQFPTGGEPLDRELAEALGRCGEPEAIPKILAAIPRGDANPALQIHYVSCLRSIGEDWTPAQKAELLAWFQKTANWRAGGANLIRSLAVLFDAALQAAFTKEESRLARRRIPRLARLDGGAAVNLLGPEEIFEAQMASPATLEAHPERGRDIFKTRCAACHRAGELGPAFAPDLTKLSARLEKEKILEAVLWPHREVEERYRSIVIETADGHSLEALLVREDSKVLLLKIPSEANPVSIRKSQVKSRRTTESSIMPLGVLDGLGQADIASLLAFLE